MELKKYQLQVIKDLDRFLELLIEKQNISKAYNALWNEKGINVGIDGMPPYNPELAGVPQVCFKVPTGGGKTFLAANSLKPIFASMPHIHPKAVVWLVPSDAILSQTYKTLTDKNHAYRKKIDVDFGNKVEVYSKQQLLNGQNFNPTSVSDNLSIFVLSYDSFRTSKKDGRKAYQENGSLLSFVRFKQDSSNLLEDTDGRISRSELEQILNYSGNYLNTIVKKYTHKCLFDYGQTFCMKKAATLLKETTSSISEIMEELHFTNTTHFYKCFKEHYHMTPNQFRISSKNKH